MLTIDKQGDRWGRSGEVDAFGQWQWSVDRCRRMLEEAGFGDVAVADLPTRLGIQVVRGVAPTSPAAAVVEAPERELVEAPGSSG